MLSATVHWFCPPLGALVTVSFAVRCFDVSTIRRKSLVCYSSSLHQIPTLQYILRIREDWTKHCTTTKTLEKKVVRIWILLTSLASLSSCHGETYWKIKGFKYRNLKRQNAKISSGHRYSWYKWSELTEISGPLLSQTTSLTVSLKSGTDSSDSPGLWGSMERLIFSAKLLCD